MCAGRECEFGVNRRISLPLPNYNQLLMSVLQRSVMILPLQLFLMPNVPKSGGIGPQSHVISSKINY